MKDNKQKFMTILIWVIRIGVLAYFGNEAFSGDLAADLETILAGGVYTTTEIIYWGVWLAKTLIPEKQRQSLETNLGPVLDLLNELQQKIDNNTNVTEQSNQILVENKEKAQELGL